MLSMVLLWISATAFGQSMDWSFLASNPGVTYVDNTKLSFTSTDGLLKVEYELVKSINGDNILYYDIQVSPLSGDPVTSLEYHGYSEGSIYEPTELTTLWDNYEGSPLSGSVILPQNDPETLNLVVNVTTSSNINQYFGLFTTYYPN